MLHIVSYLHYFCLLAHTISVALSLNFKIASLLLFISLMVDLPTPYFSAIIVAEVTCSSFRTVSLSSIVRTFLFQFDFVVLQKEADNVAVEADESAVEVEKLAVDSVETAVDSVDLAVATAVSAHSNCNQLETYA